ncbi:hypothetical protein OAS45_02725 [Polaribacter sp.]|nr:hypothetical protein [Polaribacter sp.]MDC1374798.1 hypothetical protein [Polaribacter sp.]
MNFFKIIKYRGFMLALLLCSFNCAADSPLTSISFWEISDNNLVQQTGCLEGEKRLNNKNFNFLVNPEIPIFHKIALVNALGWEFDKSTPSNYKVFLEMLKTHSLHLLNTHDVDGLDKVYNYQSKAKFTNDIVSDKRVYDAGYKKIVGAYAALTGCSSRDISLIYLYLAAMDNYRDVSLIHEEFNAIAHKYTSGVNKNLEPETEESFNLVKMLVSTQYSLIEKGITPDVWEQFNLYLNKVGTANVFINKTLPHVHKYLSSYKKEKFSFLFSNLIFNNFTILVFSQ